MKSLISILLVFFLAACHQTGGGHVAETTDAQEDNTSLTAEKLLLNEQVAIGPLQVQRVSRKINTSGVISIPPSDLQSVHSKSEGFVRAIKCLPGDFVRKGSLLMTVEYPGLLVKQRELLETRANLGFAETEFERVNELEAAGAASTGELQKVRSERDFLQARYLGLRRELELIGTNIDKLESELDFQPYVYIYAPVSGYVHEVYVNSGKMVHAEDQLLDIADNSHMHLELEVFARDVAALSEGQTVKFSIPGHADWLEAEVVKLNPMIDRNTGTLQVHCHLDDDARSSVKAGMFAHAIIQANDQEVSGLPLDAVIKEGLQYYAYGIKNNQVVKTALEDVVVFDDFVSFAPPAYDSLVVAGAYYLE